MRVQRHKAARKALAFYKIAFGIVPPYKLLLDGNFVAQAVRMSIDFQRLLPKLLHAETAGMGPQARVGTYLHVTDCCLEELRSLGPKGEPIVAAAMSKGIGIIRCRHKHGHAEGTDASECIRQLVGATNTSKYFVATQDAGLRDALRRVPGTPLILFSQNVMVLEPPSDYSRKAQSAKEAAKASVQSTELAAIARTVKESAAIAEGKTAGGAKRKRSDEEGEGGDGGSDDEGDEAGAKPPASKRQQASSKSSRPPASLPALLAQAGVKAPGSGPAKPKKKKRKGPSGPNPLSVKRKEQPGKPGPGAGDKQPRRKRAGGPGAGGDSAGATA